MNSIQYDNNRVENSKENEKVGRVRRRRGSSYPINRSINRGLHERNKEGGKKKEQRIFSLLDQTVVEYPQTLATWRLCTMARPQSLEPLSPLARTRDRAKYPHESPLDPLRVYWRAKERGRVYYFCLDASVTRGIISGFDLENRGIAIVSCSIFIKL